MVSILGFELFRISVTLLLQALFIGLLVWGCVSGDEGGRDVCICVYSFFSPPDRGAPPCNVVTHCGCVV